MYQMYAYQKKYGANHVTLVYPKTDKVAYETGMEYRSDDGVTVRIRFVDLFDVQKSIEQLYADFFAEKIRSGCCYESFGQRVPAW